MFGRRGFLGLLAGAPVAGPQLLFQGQSNGQFGNFIGHVQHEEDAFVCKDKADNSISEYESYKGYVKNHIAGIRKINSIPLSEYIRKVDHMDTDLISNKSLSLSSKVRIQAQRDKDRLIAARKVSLSGILKEMKSFKSLI